MKLLFTIVLLVTCSIAYTQNVTSDKYYIANSASFGLGISSGKYSVYNYHGQNRTLQKSRLNFSPEYHITAGFILQPNKESSQKLAIETGFVFGTNSGRLLSNGQNELKLSQFYWGVPAGAMVVIRSAKSILKYGAGVSITGTFYETVEAIDNTIKVSELSLFTDGRVGFYSSGAVFFKTKKENRYWGFGVQAGQELNGSLNRSKSIPFSLRNTRISLNLYPFLWFFKD